MKVLLINILLFLAFSCNYPSELKFDSEIYPIKKGNKWGYVNEYNRTVIPFVFDSAEPFMNNRAIVETGEAKCYINKFGKIVIFPEEGYDILHPFESPNLTRISQSKGSNFYFIDSVGTILFRNNYMGFEAFSYEIKENIVSAGFNDSLNYFINDKGEILFRTDYQLNSGFSSGIVQVWNEGGEAAYLDKSGNIKLKLNGYCTKYIKGYISATNEEGVPELLDIDGKVLYKPKYIMGFNYDDEGYGHFRNEVQKVGLIDIKGEVIAEPIFDAVSDFKNGAAAVSIGNKWGFINEAGKIIIPIEFDEIYYKGFIGALAKVRKGNKRGYINKSGHFVIVEIE